MKKIWILMAILGIAAVFLAGLYFGSDIEASRIEGAIAQGNTGARLIAVVNADTGVIVDDDRLNYSAAIIETLGGGFTVVSPAMAQYGLRDGIYRAVLTFPSNVSERILSFNTDSPERVVLEFQVNPTLSESEYIATHVELMELQIAINLTMGFTYVSSVLSQFHIAQDEMGIVFRNKEDTAGAIEVVRLEDFSPTLQLELPPETELDFTEADTSEYFLTVTGFAEQVKMLYLTNFEAAAEGYAAMREVVDSLTDDFPRQREEWLEEVESWSDEWIGYTYDLHTYFYSFVEYKERLLEWRGREAVTWHSELVDWHSELAKWQKQLEEWHKSARDWYDNLSCHSNSVPENIENTESLSDDSVGLEAYSAQPVIAPPPIDPPPAPVSNMPTVAKLYPPQTWDKPPVPPTMPDEYTPPQPEGLWEDIYLMRDTMLRFNIEDYLTDALWEQVQSLLGAYYNYLDFVRDDLSFQFLENIFALYDVRLEYIEYLHELREAIFESEYEARGHLQETLYAFFGIADDSSLDTQERLSDFAGMMPETRRAGGVNQDMANFIISPVQFMAPILRGESDLVFTSNAALFLFWLWVGLVALAVVSVSILVVYAIRMWKARVK